MTKYTAFPYYHQLTAGYNEYVFEQPEAREQTHAGSRRLNNAASGGGVRV